MTRTGAFHQSGADREVSSVQRQQIDPADHDVPAQQRWIHLVAA
jgi:hypothetical protein